MAHISQTHQILHTNLIHQSTANNHAHWEPPKSGRRNLTQLRTIQLELHTQIIQNPGTNPKAQTGHQQTRTTGDKQGSSIVHFSIIVFKQVSNIHFYPKHSPTLGIFANAHVALLISIFSKNQRFIHQAIGPST